MEVCALIIDRAGVYLKTSEEKVEVKLYEVKLTVGTAVAEGGTLYVW